MKFSIFNFQFSIRRVTPVVIAVLLAAPTLTLAAPQGDLNQQYQQRMSRLEEIKSEQEKLRRQIADAQNQERTLANQINYFNNQIRLTELNIQETENQIIETQEQLIAVGEDIDGLQAKLANLDDSMGDLTRALNARIRAGYETTQISPMAIFLASNSFQDAVRHFSYLKALQEEDKKLLGQMQETRGLYAEQKRQLEDLRSEKENLKTQLENQKTALKQQRASLSQQQESKQYLLKITQNDEAKYQQLLRDAEAEQREMEQAVNKILQQISGRVLEGTPVKAGDIIGVQGCTGYCTGPHLHFGYYPCGDWSCPADPESLLNNGSLAWPMDHWEFSQHFGLTPFALTRLYPWRSCPYPYGCDSAGNPNIHNGIDIYGPSNSAIKAAADGTIYYAVDSAGGHGAIIQHDSGYMTIYWHLQPRK